MEKKDSVSVITKGDLVAIIAESCGVSKAKAECMIDAMAKTVKHSLVDGVKVSLRGFFTAKPVELAARKGRNPSTGEPLDIPARIVAKFKAGFDI